MPKPTIKKKGKAVRQRTEATAPQGVKGHPYHFVSWALVIVVMLFIAAIRARLLSIPLERDEGEYAYMGQLMLQGIPPYSLAANMKLPGTYGAYALIMTVFGQTIEGIHMGFLLINLSTMLMVFLLTRRLFDDYTGVISCATFGILSLSPGLLGTSAHATHFVLLPALGGIILLLKALETNRPTSFLLSGFLLGLSFIMKQSGIFFCIFALLYLVSSQLNKIQTIGKSFFIRTVLFSSGVLIPYLVTCVTLYTLGVFNKFWFWTVLYAYQYGTLVPFAEGKSFFLAVTNKVIGNFYLLWGLAAVGLIVITVDKQLKTRSLFMSAFLLFSFFAICPGLYFREHYFVHIVPAVAIFSGNAVTYLKTRLSKFPGLQFIPILLYLLFFSHGVFLQKSFFFTLSPEKACRQIYFPNPFPESIAIGNYIKKHSAIDSTVAVLGSEPQIYFYARRRSATSYLYTYSLREDQKYAERMQREMIREIEGKKPEYLIYINKSLSQLMVNWYMNYAKQYNVVGIIDIVSPMETKYFWADEVYSYRRSGSDYIFVLKALSGLPSS